MLEPVRYYRVARWLYLQRVPLLPRLITRFSELLFHCYLPYTAEIGKGFNVGYHGVGVVVHGRARLGENVFMGPGAIIGGRSQLSEVPRVGANVYIAAGAKVLGDIDIGEGSVIGANAVVVHSMPARSIAAGVPARIIRENVNVYDYTGWPPKPPPQTSRRKAGSQT